MMGNELTARVTAKDVEWMAGCGQMTSSTKCKEQGLKLNLEVHTREGLTIIFCRGRVTYRDEALALSAKVAELLSQSKQIILELSGVHVMDSAGLGELVVALVSGQITGCPVKLAAPTPWIRQLLELTNLSTAFDVHPSLESAVQCYGGVDADCPQQHASA